mmetsp:Transcript_44396/g.126702  ORF Transcript_44396/g.126702 Transcript_44396/m.126702 type:complete len:235 (+) Transcript_44396:1080-1784(+)
MLPSLPKKLIIMNRMKAAGSESSTRIWVRFMISALRSMTRWKLLPRWPTIRTFLSVNRVVFVPDLTTMVRLSQSEAKEKPRRQIGIEVEAPTLSILAPSKCLRSAPARLKSRSCVKQFTDASISIPKAKADGGSSVTPAAMPALYMPMSRSRWAPSSVSSARTPEASRTMSGRGTTMGSPRGNSRHGLPSRSMTNVFDCVWSAVVLTFRFIPKNQGTAFCSRKLCSKRISVLSM